MSNKTVTVLGCADLVPPLYAWYKREGDAATIGCEYREMSWHLKCENNRWTGVVGGNCTEQRMYILFQKFFLYIIFYILFGDMNIFFYM